MDSGLGNASEKEGHTLFYANMPAKRVCFWLFKNIMRETWEWIFFYTYMYIVQYNDMRSEDGFFLILTDITI